MATDITAETETAEDQPAFRFIAGECEIETTGPTDHTHRGQVVVLIKPDDTVLVHDISGYKPVAWMTRADTISADHEAGVLTAVDGDHWLRIEVLRGHLEHRVPGSYAGEPIGTCPECDGTLVEAAGTVHCVGCRARYGLPSGSMLTNAQCACGLPRMRVERGDVFDLCIDRECEPMETAIAERFDGTWECPESGCPGHLRIIRRGGLLAACDQYPECEAAFSLPAGMIDGHCGCGLPRFAAGEDVQCLDTGCELTG